MAPDGDSSSASRGRGDGNKGRGRGRGRGGRSRGRGDGTRGGGRGGAAAANSSASAATTPAASIAGTGVTGTPTTSQPTDAGATPAPAAAVDFKSRLGAQETAGEDGDAEVCFICANPVSHHSIAPCNHVTCHICALRLRALYKSKDCPHCRTPAPFVIFTDDATRRFETYSKTDTTSTDDNIGIRYVNEDIVGDTVLLLRYNCPDASCDFAGLGWPDLHRHVRSAHHKKMCDLCTRNKKVFTHEHELFADRELERHMRKGDDKPGAIDQTGFKGHPLCTFCGERFYDGDKLYEHCRNRHERCFVCDRRDSRQPHYYLDYDALERHFRKDHFLCLDRECLEKKFVVFESELDLKAHQLSEHADTLSKDVRRDARLVDLSGFDYRQSYQPERRGGGGGGSSSRDHQRNNHRRGPDPNSEPLPPSSAQPLRRDQLAFQRQMAVHSAQSVSTRTFGGQLSAAPSSEANQQPSQRQRSPGRQQASSGAQPVAMEEAMAGLGVTELSSLTPEQRASLTRHGAVVERASNLLGNDATKIAAFRAHVSSYNRGAASAEQLMDAFFALFSETSSSALGTLVREVADLFEDRAKADGLRRAWQNWRAINEDYPSLPGLGGMHGATTPSSGWAAAASASHATAPAHGSSSSSSSAAQQRHSTRVLRLKNSTRRGSVAGSASSGSGPSPVVPTAGSTPIYSRAATHSTPSAASAPSSNAFPALPGATTTGSRSAQTGWIGGVSTSGSGSRGPTPRAGTPASTATTTRRPGGGEEAFPALPAAPKPLTTIFGYGTGAVRRDAGGNKPTGFSWGGGAEAGSSATTAGSGSEADAGGGKGGKKKKKQVLVQWG